MARPIRSRHGLTRCPACRRHIRAEDRPSETACPFCGAFLTAPAARPLITSPTGRSGVLAASLIAFSATACGGADVEDGPNANQNQPDDPDDPNEYVDGPDSPDVDVYGMPPEPDDEPDPPAEDDGYADSNDPPEVEAYGAPPEPVQPALPPDDAVPVPAYGVVPMPPPPDEPTPAPEQ